jgi:hypothetical protein
MVIAPVTVPDIVPEAEKVWPPELTVAGSDQVVPESSQKLIALVLKVTL